MKLSFEVATLMEEENSLVVWHPKLSLCPFVSANYRRVVEGGGSVDSNEHQIASTTHARRALNYTFLSRGILPKRILAERKSAFEGLRAYHACLSKHKPRISQHKTLFSAPTSTLTLTEREHSKHSRFLILSIPLPRTKTRRDGAAKTQAERTFRASEQSLKIGFDKLSLQLLPAWESSKHFINS
jgi:hypothetical protein